MRILKDGDRLIDTDGDIGFASDIEFEDDGTPRFTMRYDNGLVCKQMYFLPIDDPKELGFDFIEE